MSAEGGVPVGDRKLQLKINYQDFRVQDVEQALTVAGRGYVLETGHVVLGGESGRLLADPGSRGPTWASRS